MQPDIDESMPFFYPNYNDENRGQPWISMREITWDDSWSVLDLMETDLTTLTNVGLLALLWILMNCMIEINREAQP
jgi:hypothetical protein